MPRKPSARQSLRKVVDNLRRFGSKEKTLQVPEVIFGRLLGHPTIFTLNSLKQDEGGKITRVAKVNGDHESRRVIVARSSLH